MKKQSELINKIVYYFLIKERLSHLLFILLVSLGLISYWSLAKDVYPVINIETIQVSGGYSGASINTLDKMVVKNLEISFQGLNGVKEIKTFLRTGSFSIYIILEDGADQVEILNSIKDLISMTRVNIPADMQEPIASVMDTSFPLLSISISSEEIDKEELIGLADKIRNEIFTISNVSNVTLNENVNKVFEIVFDNQKIEMYGLDKGVLLYAIRNLSYIFPIGKIEDDSGAFLVTTKNDQFSSKKLEETLIKIGKKNIYLSDILTVSKKYNDTDIISKFNNKENIVLGIIKNEKADSIQLAKEIKKIVTSYNIKYSNVEVTTIFDSSLLIKSRLNAVVSSILFGLIIITILMSLLINKRIAFVVIIGIPTSLLIGLIFLDIAGYSINMMTLLGTLIILGVLVDDAIIVSENIQRHMEDNEDKVLAVFEGTIEVFRPVFIASLTTVFAFIPMFVLTGEIGEFVKMIPIAIIVLIIASLIESFIFLPLHALYILDNQSKEFNWNTFSNLYIKVLKHVIKFSKTYLFIFIFMIPLLSVLLFSQMRYQLFPSYDSNEFYIKGIFPAHYKVGMTYEKVKNIEEKLLQLKNKYSIKSILFYSGFRVNGYGETDIKQNVFQFTIELENRIPQNFVEEFISPLLSIEKDNSPKVRIKSIDETILELKKVLEPYINSEMEEFNIHKENMGIVNNDIEILIASTDESKIPSAIKILKDELNSLKGIISIEDNAKFGITELKLELNDYGKKLGFTQLSLGTTLSASYLEAMQSKAFYSEGIIEIKTKDSSKDDIESLKNYELKTPNGLFYVILSDICNFYFFNNYETIYKKNGRTMKTVFANVNHKIVTPVEVLEKIKPKIIELQNNGVEIYFGGEQEQNEQMIRELGYAFFISISLIFFTLLIMFDSYKNVILLMTIIPLSVFGAIVGHFLLDMNFTLISVIGVLGLSGVVINDGIIMLDFIRYCTNIKEVLERAKLRLRSIVITSLTTFLGLSTLIFFASGQAKILQPIAISLGFGLLFGTFLTLTYIPLLFIFFNKLTNNEDKKFTCKVIE